MGAIAGIDRLPRFVSNRCSLDLISGHTKGFTTTTWEDLMSVWTVLFVILLIAWIGGFTVFHVAGGLIHLLLLFALISLVLHFVMGTRTA
jgi:hypothetical protein